MEERKSPKETELEKRKRVRRSILIRLSIGLVLLATGLTLWALSAKGLL